MRTYGRVPVDPANPSGAKRWIEVTTTEAGFDDYVWVTTLAQTLKLNLNESPFFSNYGIPAKASIVQQVAPDFYVARTQQQFASKFANLIIYREPVVDKPTYRVNVTTHQGVRLSLSVPIAT